MTDVEFIRAGYADPVARELAAELLADLSRRYGGVDGDATPVDPAEFEPPRGAFLVAYRDGAPVGCGGWRTLAGSVDIAEIKRMYVVPAARGQGIALAVLRALEDSARAAGRSRVVLETGTEQPEAINLYTKAGYARIADFGYYRDEPGVRSFGRDL
ncbi:MAG TPA: GNAT family N-acetyltransferase [Rugosimonospora sp.]|nr:GNAT family N-acetyltransferase [Rugosimonospora sp.]